MQIRSARILLLFLMKTHGAILDEESLAVLFGEVEGITIKYKVIINTTPLTVETINNVKSEVALSLSHILTM